MQQRKIGQFSVSAIGLGCMNMSAGYGPRPEAAYAEKLLNQALDEGYTFLDTAAMYGMGHNEELIGTCLASRREEYVLASKCGIFKNAQGKTETNGRPEVLQKTCEDSLRRLNTDVIDLYYLHRPDPDVPIEESVGALSRMVEQGKVRLIGLSEVSDDTLHRAYATHPIAALQSEYSLWSRTPERKVLKSCADLGIAFVPFAPLGRQFLTGKACDITSMAENDYRLTFARPRFEPDNYAANAKLLGPFEKIAEQQNCSMAQLALAWLLAQGEFIVPIPGTKHIDYMSENLQAGELVLDENTVAELDELINEQSVSGDRYIAEMMQSSDAERD
ncbi:MAG: aldo/keto reductase [Proteobacteria bacterium]|nr:aldo/keto reductase [Pseudomonadota bacterium]